MKSFKFVDLFSGLGGFHYALKELGGECVFASEIDPQLRALYIKNHKFKKALMYGDIAKSIDKVPPHDLLVAGFPCQPFSKSGKQLGFQDKNRGDCIFYVLDILKKLKPKNFIFENVSNFPRHDEGKTWNDIKTIIEKLGYCVRSTTDISSSTDKSSFHLSPHHFGYPQKRERFFAVGSLNYLPKNPFPIPNEIKPSLKKIILTKKQLEKLNDQQIVLDNCKISKQATDAINLWNKFIDCLPNKNKDLPSFPLWLEEYYSEYPYAINTPYQEMLDNGDSKELINQKLKDLPPYAREKVAQFPLWKIKFLDNNRTWFLEYKPFIDKEIVDQIRNLDYTYRKLEWCFKPSNSPNIWDHTIQLRPSGIRVSNPDYVPTIVSLTTSQKPIYGPIKRHLTSKEIVRAFGFPNSTKLLGFHTLDTKALGNTVHKELVKLIAEKLLNYDSLSLIKNISTDREKLPA